VSASKNSAADAKTADIQSSRRQEARQRIAYAHVVIHIRVNGGRPTPTEAFRGGKTGVVEEPSIDEIDGTAIGTRSPDVNRNRIDDCAELGIRRAPIGFRLHIELLHLASLTAGETGL
jgi:hypothetical protein